MSEDTIELAFYWPPLLNSQPNLKSSLSLHQDSPCRKLDYHFHVAIIGDHFWITDGDLCLLQLLDPICCRALQASCSLPQSLWVHIHISPLVHRRPCSPDVCHPLYQSSCLLLLRLPWAQAGLEETPPLGLSIPKSLALFTLSGSLCICFQKVWIFRHW